MTPVVTDLTAKEDANFKLPSGMANDTAKLSIGNSPDLATWAAQTEAVYVGELGRQKLRQSALSLITRDSLHLRLADLKPTPVSSVAGAAVAAVASAVVPGGAAACPFLLIRGTADEVFSKEAAEADVLALEKAGIKDVTFKEVSGGAHAANWTNAEEVNVLILDFVKKYGGKVDARALREAVGMVDI
jgi:alpha-beta hydrolase superfamily lysophospholipase